jgi:malonyl-CoA/methylmalonyl-CoA synthetase
VNDAFARALAAPVARGAERTAVVEPRRRVAYAECDAWAERLAADLRARQVGPGQAIVLLLGNRWQHVATLLACWRVGATPVPLDPRSTEREVAAVCAALGGRAHQIAEAATDSPPAPLRGHRWVWATDDFEVSSGAVLEPAVRPGLGMVQFTSGSSGRPKGILVGRDALLARARTVIASLELGPDDRTLCSLPLSHSHGIDCLGLPSWIAGGELHLLPPQAAAPTTVLSWLERERISFFSTVPGFYDLAVRLGGARNVDLGALRHAMCGSAALSAATARGFAERFGRAIVQGYGLAEIGPVTLNFDAREGGDFDAIGRPLAGIGCRMAEDGELVVSGAALAEGYLGQADEWAARVRDGELFTGDLAEVDVHGRYRLKGRRSRAINVDGQQVHPAEIEQLLMELPWVQAVAVVNAAAGGDRAQLAAHVVLGGSADAPAEDAARAQLEGRVQAHLSRHKWPVHWHFPAELPRSSVGKVLTERLGDAGTA